MKLKQKLVRDFVLYLESLGALMSDKHFKRKQHYKVTRGENYQDQPYVVLDVPPLKANDFNDKCRVVIWWGHYISFQYFVKPELYKIVSFKAKPNWYVFTGTQLFNNDLDHPDFEPITEQSLQKAKELAITKICMRINFTRVEDLADELDVFLTEVKAQKKEA